MAKQADIISLSAAVARHFAERNAAALDPFGLAAYQAI